jgi:hypothetical protein
MSADWLFREYPGDADECCFPSLELSVPLTELFEGVSPEESAA